MSLALQAESRRAGGAEGEGCPAQGQSWPHHRSPPPLAIVRSGWRYLRLHLPGPLSEPNLALLPFPLTCLPYLSSAPVFVPFSHLLPCPRFPIPVPFHLPHPHPLGLCIPQHPSFCPITTSHSPFLFPPASSPHPHLLVPIPFSFLPIPHPPSLSFHILILVPIPFCPLSSFPWSLTHLRPCLCPCLSTISDFLLIPVPMLHPRSYLCFILISAPSTCAFQMQVCIPLHICSSPHPSLSCPPYL